MRGGVRRNQVILAALAAFFLILLTVIIFTVRSLQSKPWDRELMHRAVLAELRLHHHSTIWNPIRVDLDQYADSVGMIYVRRAMEHAENDDWRHKYDLYFAGRKRILRDLGGANDPIAVEAFRLRCRDDSILLSGSQGRGSWPVTKIPQDAPLGTVFRIGVFYDLENGDVWRQTFTGKAGHRVYRIDYYPHLLLEDMRAGLFEGDQIAYFP